MGVNTGANQTRTDVSKRTEIASEMQIVDYNDGSYIIASSRW